MVNQCDGSSVAENAFLRHLSSVGCSRVQDGWLRRLDGLCVMNATRLFDTYCKQGDIMDAIQIQLAGLWIATMLVYLLGDVLRIFSGDHEAALAELQLGKRMWLGISVLMVMPIVMIVVTLLLTNQGINQVANIVVAIFFFLFNLVGLPTYPSAYDRFLLVVSMIFNVITVVLAWGW